MKGRVVICILMLAVAALAMQGCGSVVVTGRSVVSGTVSDINRNVLIGATVSAAGGFQTQSLATGAYNLSNVPSGWRTIWAEATVNGQSWVGSTAAYVLENEPTFNINITLAPAKDTFSIAGRVVDDTGYPVNGARVLLTTRITSPQGSTSSFDGPYGSIVAVTDKNGDYLMDRVPRGYVGKIAASKVGFYNSERSIDTSTTSGVEDFALSQSNLINSPLAPTLDFIESYTMPQTAVRSGRTGSYTAVKYFISPHFRKSFTGTRSRRTQVRQTPAGSLIEIDLYWNGLKDNFSQNIAGYGIYRSTNPSARSTSIDFVRDPYANFYADMGAEITPGVDYYYQVSSVDVQFLDANNNPDPAAESLLSNQMSVRPLDQLMSVSPSSGASVSGAPTFTWASLNGATDYAVYVYDKFPTLPLDPSYLYSDPAATAGTYPIWPRSTDPSESTTTGTSEFYSGPALLSGHTYYWVVVASTVLDRDTLGNPTSVTYSYSEFRTFTRM